MYFGKARQGEIGKLLIFRVEFARLLSFIVAGLPRDYEWVIRIVNNTSVVGASIESMKELQEQLSGLLSLLPGRENEPARQSPNFAD